MKLIGLAGTAGAGKDTVAEIVCQKYRMQSISSGDFVRAIARHVYDLPSEHNPVRDQLYQVASFMREELGPTSTVKLCIFKAKEQGMQRVLITGLRTIGEANAIHNASGVVLAVDADPKLRFDRISARRRDEESLKTYEQFLRQDAYENRGIADHGDARGIHSLLEHADEVIHNNGSLDELELSVTARLEEYLS